MAEILFSNGNGTRRLEDHVSPIFSGDGIDIHDVGQLSEHERTVLDFLNQAIVAVREHEDDEFIHTPYNSLLHEDPDEDEMRMIDPDSEQQRILAYLDSRVATACSNQQSCVPRKGPIQRKKGHGRYSEINHAKAKLKANTDSVMVAEQAKELFIRWQRRNQLMSKFF